MQKETIDTLVGLANNLDNRGFVKLASQIDKLLMVAAEEATMAPAAPPTAPPKTRPKPKVEPSKPAEPAKPQTDPFRPAKPKIMPRPKASAPYLR